MEFEIETYVVSSLFFT